MYRYVIYKCAVHKLLLYTCVSYDGQCIVMNVLQLFRLIIAWDKKLFLCLTVLWLVLCIADKKATDQRESGQSV